MNIGIKIHFLMVRGAFGMKAQTAAIDIANQIAVQKLIREYLVPPFNAYTEAGVSISAVRSWNRSGVHRDAATWLYEFSGNGWEMVVRAVFHEGELLEPIATHCVIEMYDGTDIDAACLAANQWLRSLSL